MTPEGWGGLGNTKFILPSKKKMQEKMIVYAFHFECIFPEFSYK